jgi:hypothetical protein
MVSPSPSAFGLAQIAGDSCSAKLPAELPSSERRQAIGSGDLRSLQRALNALPVPANVDTPSKNNHPFFYFAPSKIGLFGLRLRPDRRTLAACAR